MYTFYIGTKNFLNEMTKHPVTEPYLITLSAPYPAVKIKNLPALQRRQGDSNQSINYYELFPTRWNRIIIC